MSVEFRLTYKGIRDVIDRNVNEVLLKWNARKVILDEPFDEERKELCVACIQKGQQRYLKYSYVNLDEAVYKCESSACLFPFRNFKYKNFTDRTIFRYERIMTTDEPKEKVFASPTKVENDDMDFFNISWLDHSFTTETDLDTILTSPSEACDIKEIINNICGNVETSPKNNISPSKVRNEQLPTTAPKLSKCLRFIQHLSPPQQTFSNKMRPREMKTSTPLPVQISRDCTPKETISKFKYPEMLKASTKCIVKNPTIIKNYREISPIKLVIVDQHPLANGDRLDVICKKDPEKKQCKFTQVKEKIENGASISSEKSVVSSNQLPILIEIIGTSASYHLDVNQLSNGNEPCSSHQLEHNDLQTTQNSHDSTQNATIQERITSQTMDHISSEEQISTTTDSNSFNIKLERSEFDFQIVKSVTNTTLKDQQKEETPINENLIPASVLRKKMRRQKLDEMKAELRIKKLALQNTAKEKRGMKKQKLQKKLMVKKEKKQAKVNTNRNNLDIEDEESFRGFETLEPFKPIQLQTQPLVWLKTE